MTNKKQGHTDPATCLVFVEKRKHCKNGEYWVTPEKYEAYKERKALNAREFRRVNKAKALQSSRDSYRKYKEKRLTNNRVYRENNKIKIALMNKQWAEKNKEHKRAYARMYHKNRRLNDPLYALSCRCRVRITDVFRCMGFTKRSKSSEMLGCDWDTLKQFIEQQFTDGMDWTNRDQWHIDHITPLASAKTEERLIELCHYTNLQPLWASENMSKGSKIGLDYSLNKSDTTVIA
jgi:hypothetical protein